MASPREAAGVIPTADARGLLLCLTCGQLNRAPSGERRDASCARCAAPLHRRKPNALRRAWAYLFAAAALYVPANVLPVLSSSQLAAHKSDTILSGVVYFWNTGSFILAAIIFVASIAVPATKIAVLAFLLLSVHQRSTWRPYERTQLYRLISYIGRWSMVDIFVGATTVALVQLQPFATIEPGPGAIFFGAVVILTMLASESFDPRLMWDVAERRGAFTHE